MLTTPVIKDEDIVFPGEGWFLYWKTSSSLWKSKLEEISLSKLLIPINWSFHTDTGDKIDFAHEKPETDLAKLVEICHELGKEAIFLLPLTPVPYLPNGGVPFVLARTLSESQSGRVISFADGQGSIHKIYSYYDPRIFKAFSRFCFELNNYFSTSGISSSVWGIECGSLSRGVFSSFIEDSSQAFNAGFSRFLDAKRDEKNLETLTVKDEEQLRLEYTLMIKNLYMENAQNSLETYWQGEKKIGFILSEQSNIIRRSVDQINDVQIIDEAIECLASDIIPSSVLIPNRNKEGAFQSFKKQQLNLEFIENSYNDKTVSSANETFFKSSYTIKIFQNSSDDLLNKSGFLNYCQVNYQSNFCFTRYDNFEWEEELDSPHEYYYFLGRDFNLKTLSAALRMFMNGLNIFIDKNLMDENLIRRLESFYLENDLEIERIRFITEIETISMGEGRLFIFNSADLAQDELNPSKVSDFWDKVFHSINNRRCKISSDEGIRFTWMERGVGPQELKFEKVKRLNVYNPSSYKRKMKISYPSLYVFNKVVDEKNVSLVNTTHEIELNFLPKGNISLDFGVISQ